MAPVNISFAGPGATAPRLSDRAWVAELPITPSIDTSTSNAGKIDSTP